MAENGSGNEKQAINPEDKSQKEQKRKRKEERKEEGRLMVVGIGCSAGGLGALQAFFDALPNKTGMAFVVVTHLHPERESHLAELLQTHTKMPVEQVNEMTSVERDSVYVIPPNRRIVITDTHLDTSEFEEPRGLRTPIDHFFRSLASVHRDAIGIILSGGGTDGSVGIKAIKEQGGLLLVQHPDEAEYDSMPRAAISTGLADLVLPVRELATKLVEYSQLPLRLPRDADDLTEKEIDIIRRILAQVNARTGHDFSQYKRATILRRIQRRMQLNGYTTLNAYLDYLRHNEDEAHAMFNDLLIGVTNFFRDRESWEALAEQVIPPLFAKKEHGDTVRAWAIGCATGEEAYSLAMLLLEFTSNLEMPPKIQVFASDLDEYALTQAREGYYPAAIEADVSPERLKRFFVPEGNHYRVRRELRDVVLFTSHSILRDPPFSHQDLISCRNLLIYLQHEMQDRVFDIFHYALNLGGYLFLGSSESAETVNNLFSPVDKTHRIYQARPWRGEHPHIPLLPVREHRLNRPDEITKSLHGFRSFADEVPGPAAKHVESLEALGPPSILLTDNGTVLHLSETAGRFLLQPRGPITNQVLKLVRPELQYEMRSALFQAFENERAILSQPVPVSFNGNPHLVTLYVRPVRQEKERSGEQERQALVFFLEDEITWTGKTGDEGLARERLRDQESSEAIIDQLEREARVLRERLQTTTEEYESSNEEMKAANEELQSMNEEYRSATEELETSKEELQSINEELQTVNNELKNKLDEISRSNSDLENLILATEIATLFLDRELRIQRFTPGMEDLFNLIDADRGRPIAHLTNKLAYDRLVEDAEMVLRNLMPIEQEVLGGDERWFLLRMRPYRTVDDRIDGVVITFVDITKLKKAEKALIELNETLEKRVANRTQALDETNQKLSKTRDLFYTLFYANPIPTALSRLEDGVLLDVNQAYLSYFDIRREEALGQSDQGLNRWLKMDQQAELLARIKNNISIRNYEREVSLPDGGTVMLLVSFQQVEIDDEEALISSFIDITERVKAERQNRILASELTVAEQKERQRISQLLHDDLQQRIYAVQMQLSLVRNAYEKQDLQALETDFVELEEWLGEAISITRNLSIELSPPILRNEGLVQALNWLVTHMQEQYDLEITLRADDQLPELDHSLQVMLFQTVRELLFNVVKHAEVLQAEINLEKTGDLIKVRVMDEGVGFDVHKIQNNIEGTHGLPSIRHRLDLLGCSLEVESEPGKGTQVTITVPYQSLSK